MADISSVQAHLLHQVGVIVARIDRVVAAHVLVTGRVASLDVIVRYDLLDLVAGVLEVSLGAQSLGDDGDVVIVFGRVVLVLDGADVDLLLVDHDHHLPLVLILGDTPEAGASEVVAADVVMDSLGLSVDNNLVEILLMFESLQQFDLDLTILTEALRLLDLIAQSDLHRGVSIIIFVIHRLRLVLMGGLLDWHAVILVHLSLAIHQDLILFHLEESGQKRIVTGLGGFLDLLTFPRKLLVLSLTNLLD